MSGTDATTTDSLAQQMKRHPAKFSPAILDTIGDLLADHLPGVGAAVDDRNVLDPFGGVGGVHQLDNSDVTTWAIELEPEWARISAHYGPTHCGDFLQFRRDRSVSRDCEFKMVDWGAGTVHSMGGCYQGPDLWDAIVTSPAYGNRMADHHVAKDGSDRLTYRHRLGRELSDNNSGGMQWGDRYRKFHWRAWFRSWTLLKPGGLLVLNVKDHIRGGEVQRVSAWHRKCIETMGFETIDHSLIPTRGMGFGQHQQVNDGLKIDHENVYVFKKMEN